MNEVRVVIHRRNGRVHRCVVEQHDGTFIELPICGLEFVHDDMSTLGLVKLSLWANRVAFEDSV